MQKITKWRKLKKCQFTNSAILSAVCFWHATRFLDIHLSRVYTTRLNTHRQIDTDRITVHSHTETVTVTQTHTRRQTETQQETEMQKCRDGQTCRQTNSDRYIYRERKTEILTAGRCTSQNARSWLSRTLRSSLSRFLSTLRTQKNSQNDVIINNWSPTRKTCQPICRQSTDASYTSKVYFITGIFTYLLTYLHQNTPAWLWSTINQRLLASHCIEWWVVCRLWNRRQQHCCDIEQRRRLTYSLEVHITDVFQDRDNLVEFLISSGHLPVPI